VKKNNKNELIKTNHITSHTLQTNNDSVFAICMPFCQIGTPRQIHCLAYYILNFSINFRLARYQRHT